MQSVEMIRYHDITTSQGLVGNMALGSTIGRAGRRRSVGKAMRRRMDTSVAQQNGKVAYLVLWDLWTVMINRSVDSHIYRLALSVATFPLTL